MKKILIIGATSAIAAACARLWARQGAALFLVGKDAEKLDAVASDLRLRGAYEVHSFHMDATDHDRHPAMLDAARRSLGELDIALIAHGTLPDQAACQVDAALTLQEFEINALSTISLLTLLASRFEEQRAGSLAVITSVAGDRGRPSNYVYGSAKAAVSTLCEGLRARLFKHGVSLTDIRPGFVATPMTAGLPLPALLVAQPDAVASRIVAGVEKRKDVVYVPAFWALVMMVIRNIPRFAFKRMSL
jgi:decaprenylphospho-beta-D-erythro-pentofuranosid-2-ulose 2-reductase